MNQSIGLTINDRGKRMDFKAMHIDVMDVGEGGAATNAQQNWQYQENGNLGNSKKTRSKFVLSIVGLIIAAMCICLISTGFVGAYLTSTDNAINTFSVANQLNIEVREANWDTTDADVDGVPDAAQEIVPMQTIKKDPQIANLDGTEAWGVIQVKVPVADVRVILDDGTVEENASQHELFTYTINSGWEEYGTPSLSQDGNYMVHTYFATEKIPVRGQTPTLFDEVKFINIIDEQFSGTTQIDVTGYGIQTYGFDTCEDAWVASQVQSV